jgi:hypothetical protein
MKRALAAIALLLACAPQKSAEKPPAVLSAPPPVSSAPDLNAFRSARPQPGSPGVFSYPTPSELVLPNGLRVLHVERPGRVVSLTLVVRHGASSVPEGKSGLAALSARLLSESTKKRSAMALAEAVESLGTSLGAGASRDDSRVSMTVLPADFGAALKLLAEVVTEPAFSTQDFDRVKNEWLDAVRAERQDPQRLAALTAFRALNGPIFGAPVNGTLADLKRLAVGDLRDVHVAQSRCGGLNGHQAGRNLVRLCRHDSRAHQGSRRRCCYQRVIRRVVSDHRGRVDHRCKSSDR